MPHLSLFLLGPLQVTLDGQPVSAFGYDKVRALLAYLAVEADRPHRREALLGLLWPELPEASARGNLRQALATLRRAIRDHEADPPFMAINRDAIQWNAAASNWLDVTAMTERLDESERHAHRHAGQCRACAERLEQAVALYRGPFLAQFSLADSAPFEEWTLLQRERLHHRMLSALSRLVAYYEQRADYSRAIGFARQQLELDSWREEAHRQLMRMLVLNGERRAALEQYGQCLRLLEEGLGVEPERETTALYEQIRDRAPDAPVEAVHLRAPAAGPHNLPSALTPFVGREAELERLTALLDNPDCRLVTVVGPGGAGKTRLALQAAREALGSFADGVYWVALAGVGSPERLARVMGESIGLSFSGPGVAEEELLAYLRNKEMLLALDNFEHLLPATPFVARLLTAAPAVSLLVTSRERLHLQGEWLFELSGLPLPAPDVTAAEWENSGAVQIFLGSARRATGALTLDTEERASIERICQLLDGMPLGIELAAAWTRLLSCAEIEQEIKGDLSFLTSSLQDLPDRHRSLRAVFDHSWRLLSGNEQRLLRSLSLFRGGFRREAAKEVAAATLPLLSALLDKSLLRRDATGRYDLHTLVRQYGEQQLEEADEREAVGSRVLHYFVALAEQAEQLYSGPDQGKALGMVAAEHDNIVAALDWSLANGEAESGLRLAVSLYRYWHWRTYVAEGRHWLEAMLAATEGAGEAMRSLRARAFHAAGVLTIEQGEYGTALTFLDQALSLRRALGDKAGEAATLNSLGVLAWELQDYALAQEYIEGSLRLRREAGQREALSGPLNNLGLVALARRDFATAQAAFEEVLAIDRECQNQVGIAAALLNLGTLMLDRERPAEALPFFRESLMVSWGLMEREGVAYALEGLAGILSTRQNAEAAREAAALFGAAHRLRDAIHMPLNQSENARYTLHCQAVRSTLDEATFDAAWARGASISLEQVVDKARHLRLDG